MKFRQTTRGVTSQHQISAGCIRLMLAALVVVILALVPEVLGHGRMMDPPARNSMWRLGFPNPVNYNDNELYCGGRITQWVRNQGKCGVCGDPHHGRRDHEAGGKYANGIITRKYTQGDVIDVTVHITANHRGYFEFRLCPVQDPKVEVTQECLDKHVLKLANEEGTRYSLPGEKSNQFFNVSLRLPPDVTCEQCVMQWKYRTGNTWDKDETGKFCVGCGPQEEFYNCADVSIREGKGVTASASSSSETKAEEKKDEKATTAKIDHQKQKNLLFTNEGNDVTQKMSEYGKLKAHYVQNNLGSGKYSTFSRSDGFNSKFGPKSSLGEDKEKMTYVQNLVNPDKVKSNTRFGYIKEGESSHKVAHVSSTSPPRVAYMWKAGIPKRSKMDSIQNRFAFSTDNSVDEYQGQATTVRKQAGFDDAINSVYVDKNANPTPSRQMRKGPIRFRNRNLTPTSFHTPSKADSDSETVGSTRPQNSLENHVTRNPALKADAYLRSLLHDKRVTNRQRNGFLNRWKRLRLRHMATLRALNSSNQEENFNMLPASVQKQKMTMKRGPQQKKISESREKKPQLSRSPFTPPPPKSRDTEFYQSGEFLSTPRYAVTESTNDQRKTTRRKYIKKKLPSWLVKALKLRKKQNKEKNQRLSQWKASSGDAESREANTEEKEEWVHQDSVNENTAKSSASIESKDYERLETSRKTTSSSHLRVADKKDDGFETEEKSRKSEVVDHTHDESIAPSRSYSKSEKTTGTMNIGKDEGKDEKSLLRYIVKWLMSKIGLNSLEEDSEDTEEEKTKNRVKAKSQPTDKDIMAPESRRKDSRGYEKLSPIVSQETNPHTPWYEPTAYHRSQDKTITETLKDKTSGRQWRGRKKFVAQGRSSQAHNVEAVRSHMHASPPPQQVETRPYNSPILRSNVPSHRRVTPPGGADQHMFESGNAFDNAKAMSTYKNSLESDYGSYDLDSRSHQPASPEDSFHTPPHYPQQIAANSWVSSPASVSVPRTYDSNHEWSTRAQRRQNYHQHKQRKTTSELICHSIATLGQGMDKWCTDNCNANFCPAFLCACEKQQVEIQGPITRVPTLSAFASRVSPIARNPNPSHWQKPVERGNDVINVGKSYIHQGRDAYVDARPVVENNQRLLSRPLAGNDPQTRRPTYRASSTDSIPSMMSPFTQNIHQSSPQRETFSVDERSDVLRPEPYVGRYPNSNQAEDILPARNPIVHRSSNAVFQTTSIFNRPQTADSWVPRVQGANQNRFQTRAERRNLNQDSYVSTHDQLHPEPLGHRRGPSHRNNLVDRGQRRLKCKAIGAYAALQHFDEWCETTCTSSMCPLLICSCHS